MKKLLLFLLLLTTSAFGQFSVIQRGPLSGNCPGASLGLDINNTNGVSLYACVQTSPGSALYQWAASGGSGSQTWPLTAGVPNYSGSNSWGTTYNASNQIPANFLTPTFTLTNPFSTAILLSNGAATGAYTQSNATIDSSGNASFGGSAAFGGTYTGLQLQGFNASDPLCAPTGDICIYTLAGTPNQVLFKVDGSTNPGLAVDGNGNVQIEQGGLAGQALCWKTNTQLSYCTSVVASNGTCTCH